MPIAHLLEEFGVAPASDGPLKLMSEVAIEDQRLASFEQGYSAGWEDAVDAQAQTQSRVTEALSNSLGDLSFTYHGAISQLIGSVEPVFRSLIDTALPAAMRETCGAHIVQELTEMARDLADQPAQLVVAPGTGEMVRSLLASDSPMPVEVIEDAALEVTCARLRIGTTEREFDASRVEAVLRQAIDAFFFDLETEYRHG